MRQFNSWRDSSLYYDKIVNLFKWVFESFQPSVLAMGFTCILQYIYKTKNAKENMIGMSFHIDFYSFFQDINYRSPGILGKDYNHLLACPEYMQSMKWLLTKVNNLLLCLDILSCLKPQNSLAGLPCRKRQTSQDKSLKFSTLTYFICLNTNVGVR